MVRMAAEFMVANFRTFHRVKKGMQKYVRLDHKVLRRLLLQHCSCLPGPALADVQCSNYRSLRPWMNESDFRE